MHLLLALCELYAQLTRSSLRLRPRWAEHNDAGELLHAAGVREPALADWVARTTTPDHPPWAREVGVLLAATSTRM